MDKADIKAFRGWYKEAALRAKRAGYDIVYVYAAHGIMTLLYQFLVPRFNHRTDEYGGTLKNRVRLVREVLEDTREAVGGECAIAFRFAVDELLGKDGMNKAEAEDIVGALADLPDLWDVNVADWANDSLPSRFGSEGFQEDYIKFVKNITDKPVVGVGRFTSPDTMVSQIKRGVLDFIGAARPSIADPFLPNKILEGRADEIRECIGCNMCTTGDYLAYPMRCTQNPTMGEEWRKGWHPAKIAKAKSKDRVMVLGGGPAGLEAALALSNRGYEVTLAEAKAELGGRVVQESNLKPLSEWKRVSDHRIHMLSSRGNVQTFTNSSMNVDALLEMGCEHIAIATGSKWRTDLLGIYHRFPLETAAKDMMIAPEAILDGQRPKDRVLVYDDDHYYLGSAIAEQLAEEGAEVTIVTPEADLAGWTHNTLEHGHIHTRLRELGVEIICNKAIACIEQGKVTLECVFVGKESALDIDHIVPVTSRSSIDETFSGLIRRQNEWRDHGIKTVTQIGDCLAPGTIAMAVYAGHEFARNLELSPEDAVFFKRENDFEIGRK